MSFLLDNLFQKQNPELASEMAKRGLIFDRTKHRWVKNPENRAQPKHGPEIPGMEGPFNYKTGNTYYYSPKEGKYYDAKSDVFMPTGFDPHTGQYVQEKPKPLTGGKWKVGGRITHEDTLHSAPMGIGTNSIVVLPESTEGMASVGAVDESGVIQSWFMRNEPIEEAMSYAEEHSKYDAGKAGVWENLNEYLANLDLPSPSEEALRHLGGNRFMSMTGAKNVVGLDDGIQFSIPRSKDKINKVRITVSPNDTYKVEFFNIRGANVKTIKEASNIHSTDLAKVFTATTGLDTKL